MQRNITNPSQMPYVALSPEAIAHVAQRAQARGKLNDKTLMKGDGNASGFTGEELIKAHIRNLKQDPENRNFDFYVDVLPVGKYGPNANGESVEVVAPLRFTFDVKSRRIKVPPRLDFDCKVPAYQVKRQKCDAYIFTAPHEHMKGGWLLGWIPKAAFLQRAKLFRKGYKHVSGIELKEDHYFIVVKDLFPISDLVDGVNRFSMGTKS